MEHILCGKKVQQLMHSFLYKSRNKLRNNITYYDAHIYTPFLNIFGCTKRPAGAGERSLCTIIKTIDVAHINCDLQENN